MPAIECQVTAADDNLNTDDIPQKINGAKTFALVEQLMIRRYS